MCVGRAVAISQPVEPAHAAWLTFNESHFLTCSMLIDKPLISAIETNVDTHLQIKKNHWLLIDISLGGGGGGGGSVAASGIRLLGGTLIDLPQKCASDSDHVAGALHYLSFTNRPKRKSCKCDRKQNNFGRVTSSNLTLHKERWPYPSHPEPGWIFPNSIHSLRSLEHDVYGRITHMSLVIFFWKFLTRILVFWT